jgi:hypothetical protein
MKRNYMWVVVALMAGCGEASNTKNDMGADGGAGDMAGGGDGGGGLTFRYVSNKISLPPTSDDFAVDLNGDGRKDNKLGDVVTVLLGQMIDLQAQEDAAILAGNGLELFSFTTSDPALNNDANAQVSVYVARSTGAPDFSGKGKFSIDMTAPKGVLSGPLAMGSFESTDPIKLTMPPTVHLTIPLYTNTTVQLPVVGARISFTPTMGGLMSGQLNGAIGKKDVDTILVPALARTFDMIAQTMPCDQNCMNVRATFDTGMCTNPDMTKATANDGKIDLCEVSENLLVQSLLSPDVDLFDSNGAWAPNKLNTDKDSVSLGVAFTGVKGSFVE